MTFDNFFLQESYKKVQSLGDRLAKFRDIIDWEAFRPIVASVYFDNKTTGGRPHTDELVIVRALVLQSLYNLSDQELEYQINDRLSFRNFVGFEEAVPDFTTIWRARERLKNAGADMGIWYELQRQLDNKGYKVKHGVIQDATFIHGDLGKARYSREKKTKKEGQEIQYTEKQKSHIDRDGSFAVKNNQVHYGYKDHIKIDVSTHLIRDFQVTTASTHDSEVDLSSEGDIAIYRDKGYAGSKIHAPGVKDKTMLKAARGHKLNGGQLVKNHWISKVRAIGERPFAVIKRVFHGGHVLVKTIERVSTKMMFVHLTYNLVQLVRLEKHGLA